MGTSHWLICLRRDLCWKEFPQNFCRIVKMALIISKPFSWFVLGSSGSFVLQGFLVLLIASCFHISFSFIHIHMSIFIHKNWHCLIIHFNLELRKSKFFQSKAFSYLTCCFHPAIRPSFLYGQWSFFQSCNIGWHLLETSTIPCNIIIFAITLTHPITVRLLEGRNHFCLIFAFPAESGKNILLKGNSGNPKYQYCFATQISCISYPNISLTFVIFTRKYIRVPFWSVN